MPNGMRTRAVSQTFLKLTKIPCAVSGRRYVTLELSSSAPTCVLNIKLNARGAVSVPGRRCARARATCARSASSCSAFGTATGRACDLTCSFAERAMRLRCGSNSSASAVLPTSPGAANSTSSYVSTLPSRGYELEPEHGELIGSIASARLPVVDHRIAEAAHVAAGFPDLRVHQQGAVETDHAEARQGPRSAVAVSSWWPTMSSHQLA